MRPGSKQPGTRGPRRLVFLLHHMDGVARAREVSPPVVSDNTYLGVDLRSWIGESQRPAADSRGWIGTAKDYEI
jgi:hypothetical protein